MNIEVAKIQAEELSQRAQGLLGKDGFLAPMLFAVSGEKGEDYTPILLKTDTDEEKLEAADLMKDLAKESEYLIFLMDTYTLPVSKEDFKLGNIPESLSDNKEASEAIVVFLYLSDRTYIKKMPYKKKNDQYLFVDQGWEQTSPDPMPGSKFNNPYIK